MKNIPRVFLVYVLFIFPAKLNAQTGATSLYENFDVSCSSETGFPNSWQVYNPLSATVPSGQWTCSPDGGRNGSPGIQCSGTYSGSYHLDTSYLITPLLSFNTITDSPLFLYFDTKISAVNQYGALYFSKTNPTTGGLSNLVSHDSAMNSGITPAFGIMDTGWVTHAVNISVMEKYSDFYFTFMYVSSASSGNTLYMDNIVTSTRNYLETPTPETVPVSLKVIGQSTPGQLTLSYSLTTAGDYNLIIYDVLGHEIYKDYIHENPGSFTKTINPNAQPGMYLIKLGNGYNYALAKTIIY